MARRGEVLGKEAWGRDRQSDHPKDESQMGKLFSQDPYYPIES